MNLYIYFRSSHLSIIFIDNKVSFNDIIDKNLIKYNKLIVYLSFLCLRAITVKAFVVTPPHEMWDILVINIFELIFIAQFIN